MWTPYKWLVKNIEFFMDVINDWEYQIQIRFIREIVDRCWLTTLITFTFRWSPILNFLIQTQSWLTGNIEH